MLNDPEAIMYRAEMANEPPAPLAHWTTGWKPVKFWRSPCGRVELRNDAAASYWLLVDGIVVDHFRRLTVAEQAALAAAA
jgi:hypothetical protein